MLIRQIACKTMINCFYILRTPITCNALFYFKIIDDTSIIDIFSKNKKTAKLLKTYTYNVDDMLLHGNVLCSNQSKVLFCFQTKCKTR